MNTLLYNQRPPTTFSDPSKTLFTTIAESEYSVLVGKNNCGKSFFLKTLTQALGGKASYLGPGRYQNFNLLGYYTPNSNLKNEKWQQFSHSWNHQQQNIDNSPINLQQAIAQLSNDQRRSLSEIIKVLLGVTLEVRDTIENNAMSQKYISCGGHNISYTSSGLRLITTLVTSLLDTDYDTFLIDEPELGISPEAQGILADFLFNREHRAKYFPHIKTLIFATHSTIFLDRNCLSNNYRIEKNAEVITISPTRTQLEFNSIHFFLLGNRFETLYLPSAIVLVEGKSDHKFFEKVLSAKYPNMQFSVITANCDNRIKEILSIAKGLFTDIQKSPYRDRIFVVLDSVHAKGLPDELAAMGIPKGKVLVWPKNGLEYYYPPAVLDKIYGAGSEIQIAGDDVSRNGITHKKAELADLVSGLVDKTTIMHPDFDMLFLKPLESTLGMA